MLGANIGVNIGVTIGVNKRFTSLFFSYLFTPLPFTSTRTTNTADAATTVFMAHDGRELPTGRGSGECLCNIHVYVLIICKDLL